MAMPPPILRGNDFDSEIGKVLKHENPVFLGFSYTLGGWAQCGLF